MGRHHMDAALFVVWNTNMILLQVSHGPTSYGSGSICGIILSWVHGNPHKPHMKVYWVLHTVRVSQRITRVDRQADCWCSESEIRVIQCHQTVCGELIDKSCVELLDKSLTEYLCIHENNMLHQGPACKQHTTQTNNHKCLPRWYGLEAIPSLKNTKLITDLVFLERRIMPLANVVVSNAVSQWYHYAQNKCN